MTVNLSQQTRFLIVDDDELILDVCKDQVQNLGYADVETALNGNIALGKLISATAPYDIIICDLNMPEMNGVEFLRHLAECNFEGGLIIVSGEDARIQKIAYEMAASRKINILGTITKPITPIALQELIDQFKPVSKAGQVLSLPEVLSEEELRRGIFGDGDELTLYYQPIVHLRSGEIEAVEALARWAHASRGMLGPDTFVPLAEENGLINDLTNKIFLEALRQAGVFLEEGGFFRISVNFSIQSFLTDGFVDNIIKLCEQAAIDPAKLVLEFNEHKLLEQVDQCLESMMRLRFKRFGMSIDDFGVGGSSIQQLERIPFTELKVSRSFVSGASQSEFAKSVLAESVTIARSLGMKSIAKGVESLADWIMVEELGFDYAQGRFCGAPMAPEDLAKFIGDWSPPPRRSVS
ncbi:MAG: EAL domain-containing response regulator [Pseudohongiellaceae bacterium]